MKKKKKFRLGRFIIIAIIVVLIFFCIKNNDNKIETMNDLINISECSEEFMNEYYDNIQELKESENNEDVLIVISKNKIPEGSYGAIQIIEAPNNQYILQYNSEEEKNKALESLKQDNNIISAEENIQYTLAESNYNSWGIEATGLDKVMQAAEGKKLDDITVAIIDTGCDVEMINSYFPSKITETYNVLNAKENNKDVTDVTDNHGHGTRMAEIIAEGTSSNVSILPIKVSEGKTLDTIYIIAAMNHIIYKNLNDIGQNIDIVNMSFVTYSYSDTMVQLINEAANQNIIVVAAAGNDYTSQKAYPAAYDNTLSIGACDSTLKRLPEPYDFSNYGSTLDFVAPGVNIMGLDGKTENAMSGTSTSAPHAASAIAMIKGYNKDYTYEEVFKILKENAIDEGETGKDNYYGYGVINLSGIEYCSCKCDNCDIIYCFGCECQECVCKNNVEEIEIGAKEYECEWEYEIISEEEKTIRLTKCKITEEYDGVSKAKIVVPEKLKIKNEETQEEIEYTVKEMSGKIQSGSAISVFPNINLETIILPNTITKIGDCTFAFKENLKNINLPEGLITIGNYAFYECFELENIIFPESLESIGVLAFMSCSNLQKINIEKNVKAIGEYAFMLCTALGKIEVDNLNENYDSRENANALIDTKNNRLLAGTDTTIIPSTVKTIGGYAFANNFKLPYIEIPEGVENVEDFAFYNCAYTQEIILPKSLETIGESAFIYMSSATIWVYKDSTAKEYLISKGIPYKCIDPTTIEVYVADKEYKAFEKVNTEGMYIILNYDDGREEKIEDNINIKYANEELDSFRTGDTYFTVSTTNSVGQYIVKTVDIEEQVEVTVTKAIPKIEENEIPTGLKAKYGDKLSDVVIGNDRFTWKNPEEIIDEIGNLEFEAIYTPLDSENYDVFEVKINIQVEKAIPEYEIPTGLKAKYGDKLSDVVIGNDRFTWKNPEEIIGQIGEIEFDAMYTPLDIENYETVEVKIKVKVEKAIPEYEIPTGIKAKYGDKLSDVVIGNDRYTWKNSEEIIDKIGEIEFDAIYTPLDSENYEKVEVKIKVKVEKAYIEYTCDKDYEYDGQPHGVEITINNPENAKVKFMDENGEYTLDEAPKYTEVGTYEIKYKIYVEGNDNYEVVEETVILTISKKIEIINSTTDYEGVYDGKEHSIKIDINTTNFSIKYSVNNKNYNLTTLPKFKDIGEYTINYKITVENHEDIIGSNKVRIYGIKSIDSSIGQKGNILIIKNYNSSFKNLSSKIKLYAKSSTYKHFDVKNVLVNSDITKTGDKIKVNINGVKDFEYQISILGDVNGDGKISALDYVKIKNHIMKTTLINLDVYLIAADVNDDGKISALDYVRIKNYIMNGGK